MLILYEWSFADPPSGHYVSLPREDSEQLFKRAHQLLRQRASSEAADVLMNFPFEVVHPRDQPSKRSLRVVVSPADRVQLERVSLEVFRDLARAMGKVGCYVQMIFAESDKQQGHTAHQATQQNYLARNLRPHEVDAVLHGYIGLQHGNLANFTLQSLEQFYRDLDLDIDVSRYGGSVRSRFHTILTKAESKIQAIILVGVLERFRVGSSMHRTPEREAEIRALIDRLMGVSAVKKVDLRIRTDVVESALGDAEMLIDQRGASSGVDRVHTAFHGYLHEVCRVASLAPGEEARMTELLTLLREKHPAFDQAGPRDEDIKGVMRSMAAIVDALNPLRNKASAAHPNERVLEQAEAMLVINTVRTLLHYIDSKVQSG